jgi:hypothetical protein
MLRYFPAARRRRLAPLFLVLGLFVVGEFAHDELPRDQELRFELPERERPKIEALRVVYTSEGEVYGGLERHFPGAAPEVVGHTPSLPLGRYELSIELVRDDGGITHLERSFELPSEGPVRISLREER